MAYIIAGTLTFTSQSLRDAAITRVNTAIASYNYANASGTQFAAGISTPTTTTLTFSLESFEPPGTLLNAIYAALTSTGRQSSGYLSLNRI